MPEPQKCLRCGVEIPTNAPSGHCPRCLLELAIDPSAEAPDALTKPAAGRVFDDYELQQQIGRGGSGGVVYRARQVSLNRVVALKLIRADEFAYPTLIQRFHLEAEAAGSLHHPNIVSVYETGEFDGHHYFSMELIEGTALDKQIRKTGCGGRDDPKTGRLSTRERQAAIARIVAKVARAVDYAHRHGVLHRDLKPSNIILDTQGEPHLTDFGTAKLVGQPGSSLTPKEAVLGTPSYMAPEQASGQSRLVTTAADIYSLGAILYQMLTGRPPFRAETYLETLRKVIEEEPRHPTTLVEQVDCKLATICMKCLAKEPSRRYASALALAEDLERWLRREPILARPVGHLGQLSHWCWREPLLATLAGTVILLTLVLVVVLFSLVNKEQDLRKEAQDRQKKAEVSDDIHRQLSKDLMNDLDQLWTNREMVSLPITSERRALLMGLSAGRHLASNALRLKFGVYTHTTPGRMYERFAPVLTFLETNNASLPLQLDLVIYTGYSNAINALVNGEIDFMRLGGASYNYARVRQPRIRLLAKQVQNGSPTNYGAIFTRTDSGITNFEDLKGKRFAFADPESTFGTCLAKLELLKKGIHARDLSDRSTHFLSHDAVIAAVRSGEFAAGAANSNVLTNALVKGANLRVLCPMQSITFPWVASTNAPSNAVASVQRSLLALKDPAILTPIDRDLTGFMPARPEDYNDLADRMRSAEQFDEP